MGLVTSSTVNTSPPALVNNAETIVLTTKPISTGGPDGILLITGYAKATWGNNATAVTIRVRRGTSLTGTVVGETAPITVAQAQTTLASFVFQDSPGEVSGQQYVMTLQQTGANANGTPLYAEALIVTPVS